MLLSGAFFGGDDLTLPISLLIPSGGTTCTVSASLSSKAKFLAAVGTGEVSSGYGGGKSVALFERQRKPRPRKSFIGSHGVDLSKL